MEACIEKNAWKRIDLVGRIFGRLKVVAFVGGKPELERPIWLCRCECGRKVRVRGDDLRRGKQESCGCLKSLLTSLRMQGSRISLKHDMSFTPEYRCWAAIKKNHPDSMCERWKESFEAFFEDMGKKPSPEHHVGRKRLSQGYTPSNCVWSLDPRRGR